MNAAGYFHELLRRYAGFYARDLRNLTEINPPGEGLFPNEVPIVDLATAGSLPTDYLLLNGTIHYERDLIEMLRAIRGKISESGRVIVIYYSALWRPFVSLATALKLRQKLPEQNWISNEDIQGFLHLTGFETVRLEHKILLPVYIPFVSNFVNRFLAPLPILNNLCMTNVLIARRYDDRAQDYRPTVSVVVPLRNESGNIAPLLERVPLLAPNSELIFVEGNSTDDTWEVLKTTLASYSGPWKTKAMQQTKRGKGDAVRCGFAESSGEILMILDADLTVSPEDLPKFYDAIVSGKGEFINGSRLIYPQERHAMRFLNLVANKLFAISFSYVLGQRLKDTLCGTKVLKRTDYDQIVANREFFGDFDPFGDFDLLFGASRRGLKIVEIPIRYRERTYGTTNIHRWSHGWLLLRMLLFAAGKIKFI